MSDGKLPVIRLASTGPLFRAGGFSLTPRWQEHEIAKLTKQQIETLHKRVGPWIRVYPADEDVLADLLIANPLAPQTAPVAAPDAPQATDNTKAAKAADTKAAPAVKKG